MAVLAIGAAGAAIGGAAIPAGFLGVSGAAIGFSVATSLASFLLRDKPQDVDRVGPRIGDTTIQSSAYGGMIPQYFAAARVAGNLIWASPRRTVTNVTEEEAGKGGGGPSVKTTTFTHFKSFAIALMDGQIDGIARVWRDGELFLNFGDSADAETIIASNQLIDNFIVHKGTSTQDPDSVIESFEGVGNVEAYRDTAYVVFDNMQIDRASMNFTFEIVVKGSDNYIIETITNEAGPLDQFTEYGNFSDAIGYMRTAYSSSSGTIRRARWKINYSGDIIGSDILTVEDTAGHLGPMIITTSVAGTEQYLMVTGNAPPGAPGGGRRQFIAAQKQEINEVGGTELVPSEYETPFEYLRGPDGAEYTNVDYRLARIYNGRIYAVPFTLSIQHRILAWDPPYQGTPTVNYVGPDSDKQFNSLFIDQTGVYALSRETLTDDILFKFDHDLNELKQWQLETETSTSATSRASVVNPTDFDNILIADGTASQFAVYSIDEADNVTLKHLDTTVTTNNTPVAVSNMILYQDRWIGPSISKDTDTLDVVVSAICQRSGLSPSDIDVTSLSSDTVSHYGITRDMSGRAALEPLMAAYLFDAVESDWQIKFIKRGGSSIASIAEEKLGAHAFGQQAPATFPKNLREEEDLPFSIMVQYVDLDFDYQPGAQEAKRIVTNSNLSRKLQLPIGLTKDEAKQISEILLFNEWTERVSVSLKLGPEFYYLDPADVVTATVDNTQYTIRINSLSISDIVEVEGVIEGSYTSTAVGGDGGDGQFVVGLISSTDCSLLNIPALRQEDNSLPAYYVAMTSSSSTWPGAILYSSVDGFGYSNVTSIFVPSNTGIAKDNTLQGNDPSTWDNINTLNVTASEALVSVSEDLVIAGANAVAYGRPGRYEIMQYSTAVLQANGTYTISGLLRGRNGTEWAMGMHADNDDVIGLSTDSVRVIEHSNSTINSGRVYKCVTIGTTIESAAEKSFVPSAENLMPYAPWHERAALSGNDIVVSYIRRDRVAQQALWTPINSETLEEYRIDFYNATFTTLFRSITSSTETATYLAADQTTDGVPATTEIFFRVFQVSSVVSTKNYAQGSIVTGTV